MAPGRGFLPPDSSTILHRDLVIGLAAPHRLPAVYAFRFFVTAGGLMSYGTDVIELHDRRQPTSIESCAVQIPLIFQPRRRPSQTARHDDGSCGSGSHASTSEFQGCRIKPYRLESNIGR
jgi:hypothetical protein